MTNIQDDCKLHNFKLVQRKLKINIQIWHRMLNNDKTTEKMESGNFCVPI